MFWKKFLKLNLFDQNWYKNSNIECPVPPVNKLTPNFLTHTILLSLWIQGPIRGIQMSYRQNTLFRHHARWLTEFCKILISQCKEL